MTNETAMQNDRQEVRQETRSFWKKMLVGIGLCLCAFAFMVWVCLFRNVPLEISKETTYITEPLTADGKQVDYFRAIELECYPPNMKTDENGYRMIVRAMGIDLGQYDSADHVRQSYEKLGLDPNVLPTIAFQDPKEYLIQHFHNDPKFQEDSTNAGEVLFEKLCRPWTLDEIPIMGHWLKANEPALDLIAKAVRHSCFTIPKIRPDKKRLLLSLVYSSENKRPLAFAHAFQTRANYRIGKGDFDGAIDDILSCKLLGYHLSADGLGTISLKGIQIEKIPHRISLTGQTDRQPTLAQLQKLMEGIIEINEKKPAAEIIAQKSQTFNNYFQLSVVQKMAWGNSAQRRQIFEEMGSVGRINYYVAYFGFNWNTVIKPPEDSEILSDRAPSLSDRMRSLKRLWPDFRSRILRDILDGLSMELVSQEKLAEIQDLDRAQVITLAMLCYEKEHGHLPPAWSVNEWDKPLHGWRVLLLPYLGEDAKKLYEKIRLEEPWDSEHNRQFHDAVIPFYQNSATSSPGETNYTVILGEKAAFRGSEKVKLDQFGPNSANLLLVAERRTPVCWMNPTSEVNEKEVIKEIIEESHWRGICAGFRNGAVVPISKHDIYAPATMSLDDPMAMPGSFSSPISLEQTLFPQLLDGTAERIPSQN